MMKKWTEMVMVGILLLATGCVQTESNNPPENPISNERDWMTEGYAQHHHVSIEQAKEFFVKTYGVERAKDIVKNLPERNENFEKDKEKMNGGSGEGLGEVARENYLQPDFFETFETSGKRTWVQAPEVWQGVIGIFSTPAEQEAVLGTESKEFETYLFVGSGWGVTYFQGIGFDASIEPEAPIAIEIDPPHMLAGPAFPVLDKEWVGRIRITGKIMGEVAPGKYTITIRASSPPIEKQAEWAGTQEWYVNADTIFVDPRGLATLVLNVTE